MGLFGKIFGKNGKNENSENRNRSPRKEATTDNIYEGKAELETRIEYIRSILRYNLDYNKIYDEKSEKHLEYIRSNLLGMDNAAILQALDNIEKRISLMTYGNNQELNDRIKLSKMVDQQIGIIINNPSISKDRKTELKNKLYKLRMDVFSKFISYGDARGLVDNFINEVENSKEESNSSAVEEKETNTTPTIAETSKDRSRIAGIGDENAANPTNPTNPNTSHIEFAKSIQHKKDSNDPNEYGWEKMIDHLTNITQGINTHEGEIYINYTGEDINQDQRFIKKAIDAAQEKTGLYQNKPEFRIMKYVQSNKADSIACDSIITRGYVKEKYNPNYKHKYDPTLDLIYLSTYGEDHSKRPLGVRFGVLAKPYSSGHDSIDAIFGTQFPTIDKLAETDVKFIESMIKEGYAKKEVDRTITDPEMVCNAVRLLYDTCKEVEFAPRIFLGMKNVDPKSFEMDQLDEENNNNEIEQEKHETNAKDLLRQMYLLTPEGMRPYISFICNPEGINNRDFVDHSIKGSRLINIVPSEKIDEEMYNNGYNYNLLKPDELPETDSEITKYLQILCKMKPEDREAKLNQAYFDEIKQQRDNGVEIRNVLWEVQFHFGKGIIDKVWKRATRGLSLDENGQLIEEDKETTQPDMPE